MVRGEREEAQLKKKKKKKKSFVGVIHLGMGAPIPIKGKNENSHLPQLLLKCFEWDVRTTLLRHESKHSSKIPAHIEK